MPAIAVLASDNMIPGVAGQRDDFFERDEEMGKLVPACADLGITLEIIPWRKAADRATDFAAMLPLFVWDYFEGNEAALLQQLESAAQHSLILNPIELIRWNSDKSYLNDLAQKGTPIIATRMVERVTAENVEAAFAEFDTPKLVIKPTVGGGAWRQVLQNRNEPLASPDELPPGEAMLQAFLPSVLTEGEYSLVFIDGEFSHALIKRPQTGDYRIQSIYGGSEETYTPTADERATAKNVLQSLEDVPLYARVDLLRGLDGQLKLIELELIEPYLYLPHAPGEGGDNHAARRLATALANRLGIGEATSLQPA